jgi:hypothetical protein
MKHGRSREYNVKPDPRGIFTDSPNPIFVEIDSVVHELVTRARNLYFTANWALAFSYTD